MQISLEPPAAGLARVGRHGANGCYVWYKQVTQPVAGDFAIGIVMVYIKMTQAVSVAVQLGFLVAFSW